MPETLQKLRPDRDLQCYFLQPSAIAALSETSPDGFTVSGTWRQQFDWAVIEWNRDNVFEHPAFRYLPDGNLSGLVLTYEETRTNCIPLDSELFATVDWPFLRVWAEDEGHETIYYVPLADHKEAVEGEYSAAFAEFTLSGSADDGNVIGLAYAGLHFTYQMSGDSLESALQIIVDGMNASWSPVVNASRTGTTIRVEIENPVSGANGNRFSLYSYATGTASWDVPARTFSGGSSPTKWRITLDFSTLMGMVRDEDGNLVAEPVEVPTDKIRKMRWTYSADLQPVEFERSEFAVVISNWTVTGTNREYKVAGPTSRRIEDEDPAVVYSGDWHVGRGNYSGGFIHFTQTLGDSITIAYSAAATHTLYLGTRYTSVGALIEIAMDGGTPVTVDLRVPAEDVLLRWPVGEYDAGAHSITITHAGLAGQDFYFDFLELAVPVTDLPEFPAIPNMTVATDWDTDHSLAIAPERTAWMLHSLGFHGRHNYYVGALLFYELHSPGNRFATGTVTFSGTPVPSSLVSVTVGPAAAPTVIERVIHLGDTLETIALSFAQEFNRGYTGIWASASGAVLTIQSRQLGELGELNTLAAAPATGGFTAIASGETLTEGEDGLWLTDLNATPRLNRAMRDWTRSFLTVLDSYGIDAASAFSTELKHGDRSVEAGIAQRGPAGDDFYLPTPALQTNFSPTSTNYWKQVYADCADVMQEAGIQPYLQFGEVQWWYFPHNGLGWNFSGMPFYDAWTQAEFVSRYGHAMEVFLDNNADPEAFPDEVEFLASLIGEYTEAIITHVRATHPTARFEVLYPFDVNYTAFNKLINYPSSVWTPAVLECLKTEGLGLTFTKRLKQSEEGMRMGEALGFLATQRSHLAGLGDATAPWLKEMRIAVGMGFESAVGFALDQFCLIGYKLPLPFSGRRGTRMRG